MARLELASESGDGFSALAAALPHLVWVAQPDGRVTYVNERWREYTGLDASDLNGPNRKNVVHDDDVQRTWDRWSAALASQEPYELEYRLRRASDGAFRWFIARAVPVRDAHGNVVRWIGTATDIDTQRRTSDSLRFVLDASTTLALLESEDAIDDALARIAIESYADWCIIVKRTASGDYSVPSIAHRDPARVSSVARYRDRYPLDSASRTVVAIENNAPVLIPAIPPGSVEAAAHDAEHLEVIRSLGLHSAMIAPISSGETPALGAIVLCSSESERVYEQADLDVTLAVARYAARAIERARALERERMETTLLRFTARAADLMRSARDEEDALRSLLQLATTDVADIAYIWRVEEDGSVRMRAASARDSNAQTVLDSLLGDRPLHRDGESLLKARFAGAPYVIDPLSTEVLPTLFFSYAAARYSALGIQTILSLPLRIGGTAAGSLVFARCGAGSHFDAGEVSMLTDLAQHVNLAIEQTDMLERERRIVRELQYELLPRAKMLPRVEGIAFDAVYQPSSTDADIGGDWYDALRLPDGSIAISVGDVTGRGLSAAGVMGKLRQSLSALSLYERDPARMLDALEFLLKRRSSDTIATAFVGIITPDRREIRYASAGHPYPLLKRGRSIAALESSGLPIGLREGHPSQSERASLDGADLLVLYTDGLIESNRDILKGERTLRDVLRGDAVLFSHSPASMLRDACLAAGSPDDTAILTLTFARERRWSFDAVNASAAQDARSDFVAYLSAQMLDGDLEAAEIIFGELIGNVVRHAPGPIDVHLDWSGSYPVLHVTDRGRGFTRKPALPDDPMHESGRGLYIVDALARSLRVERVPKYGTHVAVELPVRRA